MDIPSSTYQELRDIIAAQANSIAIMQQDIAKLRQSVASQFRDIRVGNSIVMGEGPTAFHADKDAFWWGQTKLNDIVGGAKGVAILMDGTYYLNP